MAIYLKYGDVKGEVTTKGYDGWIELSSLQWGAGRSIGTAARGSTSREHSEPSLSEVTVTKGMSVASPKLFLDAVAGQLDTKATIKLTTTTKGEVVDFLTYELSDCGVSNYSISSAGDMPSEHISLNFAKVMFTFKGTDPKVGGTPETVGYDLTKMKTV